MKDKDKKQKKFDANEDCFAYHINGRGKGECDCLVDLFCTQGVCRFYKSKDEYKRLRAGSIRTRGDDED